MHVQPKPTSFTGGSPAPTELSGQSTGTQDPLKPCGVGDITIWPEKPALHVHPVSTSGPEEPNGHGNLVRIVVVVVVVGVGGV